MYYVCVYNRDEGGHQEQRLEAETLEAAEALRASLAQSHGEHVDVLIEDHAHPVEYHQLGEHGEHVIGSANGQLGAWPKSGSWRDFRPAERLEPELRDACAQYGSLAALHFPDQR